MDSSILVGRAECPIFKIISTLQSSESFVLFHGQWSDFARTLGSSESDIEKIRRDLILDKISLTDAVCQIIEDWVARYGEDATFKVLINALDKNWMNWCGELLQNNFLPMSVPPKQVFSWKDLAVGNDQCSITSVGAIMRPDIIIHDNWSNLARALNIPEWRIKKFREDTKLLDKTTHSDLLQAILELWVGRNGSNAKLTILLDVIEKELGACDVGESLRLQHNWPCRMEDYENPSTTWTTISPAFKRRVKENLQNIFPTIQWKPCLADLSGVVLLDLMMKRFPRLFMHKLPGKLRYYVNRTILTRNIISRKIFELNSSSIFLFTGVERHKLSKFTTGMTSCSSEQLNEITAKFILLDQPNHFDIICGKTSEPVHLLHQDKNGKLNWIKSQGEMSGVQNVVDPSQDQLKEKEFIEMISPNLNLPICISDTPGMGKSVLLAQIGTRLVEKFPERAVIFITLSEFIHHIKQTEKTVKVKKEAIEITLQDLICENPLGKLLLKSKFCSRSEDQIAFELLLDGLDEVDSMDVGFTFEVLQMIKNSFKFIRLWVTTRPHLLNELENGLSVLGYNMLPFDPSDQLKFLTSYWSRNKLLDQERLESFSKYCLETLKIRIRSEDNDIAGIPLQCLLIGEVYEEEAISYAKEADSNFKSKILINSIAKLYKLLIIKKFQKYLNVHVPGDFAGTEILMDMHIRLSLELLFPDYFDNLKHLFDLVDLEPMVQVGIVESLGTTGKTLPRFIHRTFAEYFIALFVVNRLKSGWGWWGKFRENLVIPFTKFSLTKEKCWTKELTNFLLHRVLPCQQFQISKNQSSYQFSNHIISYLINTLLTGITTIPSHSAQHFHESFNSRDTMKRIVLACHNSNFVQIFKFFDGLQAFQIHGTTIFNPQFLIYSTHYSSLELFRHTFIHFERFHKFNPILQTEVFRLAVIRADFSIVEFLLKEKQLQKCLLVWSRTTIHDCVQKSNDNSEVKIDQKIQILGLLAGINPSLLETYDTMGRTPLLSEHIHVRLIKELLRLGANVFALDRWKDTVLHLNISRDYLSSLDYHSIVMCIEDERLRKLVRVQGQHGRTPLMSLVNEGSDIHPETLGIFQVAGCDFNIVDDEGYSALAIAIKHKRDAALVRNLVNLGADVEWRRRKTENLLHVAAQFKNVEAVQYLVKEYGMDVNVKDDDDFTPLDWAIKAIGICDRFDSEAAMALHDLGGRFSDIVNAEGHSWLHGAAAEGNSKLVELLLKVMTTDMISGEDNQGNTPLHLGVNEGWNKFNCYDITKLLLDHDANPMALNKQGELPLHVALQNKYLDLDTFKLLKSKTDFELTPHYAAVAVEFVKRNVAYLKEEEFISLVGELGGVVYPSDFCAEADPDSFIPFQFTGSDH